MGDLPLKNYHNVYILGAGFGCDAGLPTIADFLIKMRDSHPWLRHNDRGREAEAVDHVLRFRQGAAAAAYWTSMDLENIEELFSLAAMLSGRSIDDIRTAIAATLDYAIISNSKTIFELDATNFDFSSPTPWLKKIGEHRYQIGRYAHYAAALLGMYSYGNPYGKNTFITFNYDTLLEEALFELGIGVDYGFGKQSVNYDTLFESAFSNKSDIVSILKLHGSINWAKKQGRGRAFTVYRSYENVRKLELPPQIVPPTWQKSFDNQLTHVWGSAVEALEQATMVIVVGFSIPPTDQHFKYLLAAGLKNNVSLRNIIFVNPGSIKDRAMNILRKEYDDGVRIKFNQWNLNDLCGTRDTLMSIGRPFPPNVSFYLKAIVA